MESDSSRNTRWFVIALVGTMTICLLCAVSGFLVFRSVISISEKAVGAMNTVVSAEPTIAAIVPPSEEPEDTDLSAQTLETLSTTIVPINEPIELAERLRGLSNVPNVLAASSEPIEVGTIQTFWVGNVDTIENFQIDAEMVYATPHVYFWIERGVKYELDEVQALVDDFEQRSYPTVRAFFGSEWSPGIDGDEHLYILYAKDLGSYVGGYFSAADSLPPQAHQYSNGHEMFYLSADNVELWEDFTYSILAHEFQHMIHWYRDRNEESWMNEGFSELASHLSGFDVSGWDWAYADDPDIALTYWPTSGGTHYGQAFLFMAYFLDQFGAEATQALVANQTNGLASIDQTLADLGLDNPSTGEPLTADDVYRDWSVALLMQDEAIANGRYDYQSYDPPEVQPVDTIDDCQKSAGRQVRQVNQYGVDYISLNCEGSFTLAFDGASTVPVLPGEPHSGNFAVWSNRGDESDMTLTRRFNFRNVEADTIELVYWTWYDIEEGWDYLYLEVSKDGGETWTILETPSGTDEDLSGNSYGWGYSGYSGGGAAPEWIEERIDLSDYAGEEIQIRFEYITDAAVNGDGLLLDDIRVEALGYSEDFEFDEGGWQAEGFVRLYNRLPQTYSVLFVEEGRETRVREFELDPSNEGSLEVELGDTFNQATIIVSGLTRYTWQPAAYSFEIIP
jgi:immune inhibitor A